MAMEFVDGEILRSRLAREGRLPIADAVRLGIEIADALYYLHEHGVVHRDLKPENVMLLRDGGIKLIDFGIAHDATGRKMTWSGLSQSMGTPDYMAPEQVKGGATDPRTDLYALGVILYEMLTGRVPFTDENAYAAMRAKVEDELVPPRKLRPEIPAALEEVVLQALARNPHHRPESALELREALAHPASVVFRDRARRGRSERWPPTRAGVLVWIALAVTGYGVVLWALSRLP
jgi:serine/threonine-protein kinase